MFKNYLGKDCPKPRVFQLDSNAHVKHTHIGVVSCDQAGCMNIYCKNLCSTAKTVAHAANFTSKSHTNGEENTKIDDIQVNGTNRPQYINIAENFKEHEISPSVQGEFYIQKNNRSQIIFEKIKNDE